MNIKFLIWLRTLRFIASNWAVPFFFGATTALAIHAHTSLELAQALAQACKQTF